VEITVLERRNPSFDGITTGALVDKQFIILQTRKLTGKTAPS
jgi:hypothetical protein